jgi:hypothetical protein
MICVLAGLLAIWVLSTAVVFGQADSSFDPNDTPPREPGGAAGTPGPTSPGPAAKPSPLTPTTSKPSATPPSLPAVKPPPAIAQPTAKPPAQPKPPGPEFPGSALFNDRPAFLAGVKVHHEDLFYREGDHLAMEFVAERDAHLYLIYHQADGKSFLLFPNEVRTENRIAAQQAVGIPRADEAFRFRIAPPFGTEVLQVLATLQPAAELDGLVANTGRAALVPQETLEKLHERLKADLASWSEHRLPIRTAPRVEEPPPRKTERVGLFVGVSQFQVNDKKDGQRFQLGAELMAKTLIERGRLDSQKVKTLTGPAATRANIEEAVTRWLPGVSQPGDTVFVFYAGHGGTIKNLDGTKPDGKDGVLSVYDNDWESQKMTNDEWDNTARSRFISDDALARWLQELPGRQIVLLVSSCHAGSLIDARVLARFCSREAVRVKGISALNIAVVASSSPDEVTLSTIGKPVWLATFLAEAMTKLPAPVTLRQAFEYYRNEHKVRLEKTGDVGYHEPVYTDMTLLPIVLTPQ